MTIHFAPAAIGSVAARHAPVCRAIARALALRGVDHAANDNRPLGAPNALEDQVLRDALRHFAEHGLGAARAAREKAENAFFAGDRQAYDWWLGITRTLDRRLAAEAQRMAPTHGAIATE